MTIVNKTNITRQIDREYGYDLEVETSYARDGMTCHGYINGDCKAIAFGIRAESEVKRQLYAAVTFDIERGATPVQCQECGQFDCQVNHVVEETTPMTSQPTYAELVAAREAAYIAQRDAERELTQLKARLTADIAADPSFKNETSRKAELTDRLYGYDIFIDFDSIGDAYRAALAAIEVYQEAAKDARAKMRYETAQMELRAAELQLQAAQACHDAQEPTDESPYGNVAKFPKGKAQPQRRENWDFDAFNRVNDELPHQKPDAIKHKSIVPNFETQHGWVLDVWNALSTIPSGDSAGYVTKCVHDGRVRNELIINSDGQVVVFENEGDCQDYTFAMRDLHGFGEWSVREVWHEMPF